MKNQLFTLHLIVLLFACQSYAFCQTYNFRISGQIDTSFIKSRASNDLVVIIKKTANSLSHEKKIIVPLTNNGTFNIKIENDERFAYLSFEMMQNGSNSLLKGKLVNLNSNKRPWFFIQNELYLFEVGDSIHLEHKNGDLIFTGKGSEKLNCEFQMYSIEPISPIIAVRGAALRNSGRLNDNLNLIDKNIELAIQKRLTILETYKEQLDTKIYALLYLDAIGSAKYTIESQLYTNCFDSPKDISAKIVQEYFQKKSFDNSNLSLLDLNYMSESAYYADMLFEHELNHFRLNSIKKRYNRVDSFQEVYKHLKDTYTGKLRDKLLLICFEKISRLYSTEALLVIDDALSIIRDSVYKQLLSQIKERLTVAYPFELEDADGKIHKLADFKGKVLVIDFWFTGCMACSALNKAMSPIFKKYINNDEVQFVSVSIDVFKKTWLNSVASGVYTSKGTLDLYTGGLGRNSPVIQFYNIKSYPRQIIIGKSGEIITSSPPYVGVTAAQTINKDALSNINSFINIIDNSLKGN